MFCLFRILVSIVLVSFSISAFAQWKPSGNKIKTTWGENIDTNNVLPEYPRPQMVRSEWKNLNGLWNYAITSAGENYKSPQGKILVPFALESALSGVGKALDGKHWLWYERTFDIPTEWKNKRILLNFGAVDWKCEIFVNGKSCATHEGGYTPFSVDITDAINKGKNTLLVRVEDPTNDTNSPHQPRGKQALNPPWYMYTAISGIWQTVWLEPVEKNYIKNIKITPNIDKSVFAIEVSTNNKASFEVDVLADGEIVAKTTGTSDKKAFAFIKNAKLWSPENPFLYDIVVRLKDDAKTVDLVKTYSALRKISLYYTDKDPTKAKVKISLNNKPLFIYGIVDQGYWPDGLYTAPSDEALKFDIQTAKKLGFNAIRKHIKVETARWYYHCDKLGILVWQDMPSAMSPLQKLTWKPGQYVDDNNALPQEWLSRYKTELQSMVDTLYSHPCIVIWVLFNESWGQSNTAEFTKWIKAYDPTRLINPASGGNQTANVGDIVDSHNYPEPKIRYFESMKANVIGEFGALHCVVKGHMWTTGKTWGFGKFENQKQMHAQYNEYANSVISLMDLGLCGAMYFELYDVEREANGIMTYDRKILKFDEKEMLKTNQKIINSFK